MHRFLFLFLNSPNLKKKTFTRFCENDHTNTRYDSRVAILFVRHHWSVDHYIYIHNGISTDAQILARKTSQRTMDAFFVRRIARTVSHYHYITMEFTYSSGYDMVFIK